MIPLNKPHIIIILIDVGRADYFSCYGFPLKTTPYIDRFAKEAVLFENVLSTAPWTVPSHGSLFTGLYPFQHQATWKTLRLKNGIPTIFDIFIKEGYKATAISANTLLVSPYNMFGNKTTLIIPDKNPDARFSIFLNKFDYKKTDSKSILDCFIRYLEQTNWNEPQIVYINFYDLHSKYKPRQPYYSRFINKRLDRILNKIGDLYELLFKEINEEIEITDEIIEAIRAFYIAKLAMIDEDIGIILKRLKEKRILDNAILVITSDHGDILGDHKRPSFHHQFSIYNSLLKIPLIFYYPKIKPKRIKTSLIQNIDILPTILEICSMSKDLRNCPGVSLTDYICNNNTTQPRQYAFSFYDSPQRFFLRHKRKANPLFLKDLFAVQDENYKLIISDRDDVELYNIKEDKNETRNIAEKYPKKVKELREALMDIINGYKYLKAKTKTEALALEKNKRLIQKLKSLGYIV